MIQDLPLPRNLSDVDKSVRLQCIDQPDAPRTAATLAQYVVMGLLDQKDTKNINKTLKGALENKSHLRKLASPRKSSLDLQP